MENFIFCAVWETFFMQFLPDMCLVSVNELNMCLVNAELFLYFSHILLSFWNIGWLFRAVSAC